MKYKNKSYKKFYENESGTSYYVSKDGCVISKKKHIHEMKIYHTKKGYLYVKIWQENKTRAKFVHRLVAGMYIKNPDNKPEVNHKDGDKTNNNYWNLEWVTSKENKKHAKENNLVNYAYGEKMGNTSLTNKQIEKACKLMQENKLSINEISKKLNISVDILYSIRTKNIWSHISKNYVFPDIPVTDNSYSIEKIHKVCKMLEKSKDFKSISKECNVGIMTVKDIYYHRRHKNISKNYNF